MSSAGPCQFPQITEVFFRHFYLLVSAAVRKWKGGFSQVTGAGGEYFRNAGLYSSFDLRGRAVVGDSSGKVADLVELLQ
jgi:hypothetical protein